MDYIIHVSALLLSFMLILFFAVCLLPHFAVSMAASTSSFRVHNGDIIQLYCPLESGYIYGELNK